MRNAGVLIMILMIPACAGPMPQPRPSEFASVRILTPEEQIRSECPSKALARRYGAIANVLEHHPDEYTAYGAAIGALTSSREELAGFPEFQTLADDCGQVLEALEAIQKTLPSEPGADEVCRLIRFLRTTQRAAGRMSACTE